LRRRVAEDEVEGGAKPTPQNAFKIKLVERTLATVLTEAKGAQA
jgi:CO/xanthine dehydrogenase FAD-binding subunit